MSDDTPKPPAVMLIWCPKCGRSDRNWATRVVLQHHSGNTPVCDGRPIRVEYEPVRQAPLRGQA